MGAKGLAHYPGDYAVTHPCLVSTQYDEGK